MNVKLCINPNCNNFAVEGSAYCEKHFISKQPFKNAVRSNEGFYNTWKWKQLRNKAIRISPFCCICGTTEELTADHIIDPRISEAEDKETAVELFFDLNNIQVLCKTCHRKKTVEEIKERQTP